MSVEHVHALAKGARLNQYEMMSILGAGGFGITYMARDTSLDTMVAIKEYLPGDFAIRQGDSQVTAKSSTSKGDFDWGLSRFLDEARVLAKFHHPNIVRVNQIFEANNTAYLVMEYAKGESLDDLLKREGHISEQQTKDILFPILDGLKRVHEQGFLHRDIKPGNIIIREEGGAVLIDFGAARQAMETKSKALTSIVTEGYAPLEQYDPNGNQGPWTDIYALGGVAYKCLTGNRPPAVTSRLRDDPLAPVAIAAKSPVSKEFAAAIEKALRVFENQRPQSISEFAALISAAAPAAAAPSSTDEPTRMMNMDATRVMQPDSTSAAKPAGPDTLTKPPAPHAATRQAAAPPTPTPHAAGGMKAAYLGAAAAAILLVIAAGGWFYLQTTAVSQSTGNEPTNVNAAPEQVAVAPPVVPPAAAPSPAEQSPSPPEVAAGSPGPQAPPAVAANPSQQSSARPNAAPVSRSEPPRERATERPPAAAPAVTIRPSFDCAKATNNAERLVCADSQLAALDVKMAQLYKQGLTSVTDANAFSGEQQVWLSMRDVCGDKQCLILAYNDRIKELERWVIH